MAEQKAQGQQLCYRDTRRRTRSLQGSMALVKKDCVRVVGLADASSDPNGL